MTYQYRYRRYHERDPKTYSIEELQRQVEGYGKHIERLVEYIKAYRGLETELQPIRDRLNVLSHQIGELLQQKPTRMDRIFNKSKSRDYDSRLEELRRQNSALFNEMGERYVALSTQMFPPIHEDMPWYCREEVKLEYAEARLEEARKKRTELAAILSERTRIQAIRNAKEAKIAAVDNRLREHAWLVKQQLDTYPNCPYCGGSLGSNPHADHIYPVAYGGLSTRENMVIICAECNKRKGAMTLWEFIETYRLDRARIEQTLKRLGKKF